MENCEYRIELPFEVQASPVCENSCRQESLEERIPLQPQVQPINCITEARFVIGGDSDDLLKASFFSLSSHSNRLGRGFEVAEGGERDALRAVHCGTCGAQLVRNGCFRRVLPLPSPFWHEFAELSICHEDFR